MTGAVMALVGAEGGAGSSGSPAAVAWTAIYGTDNASTNTQTLSGFTGPLSISAAVSSGPVGIAYSLNGGSYAYSGAFTVHPGDTLAWTLSVAHAAKSGTLTISYGAGPTTLATIPYSVDSSWDGSGYR
jgi:hypothetical protein